MLTHPENGESIGLTQWQVCPKGRERGREVSLCFDGVVKHRERWMDGALKMSEDSGGGERDPSKTVTFGASFLKDYYASFWRQDHSAYLNNLQTVVSDDRLDRSTCFIACGIHSPPSKPSTSHHFRP